MRKETNDVLNAVVMDLAEGKDREKLNSDVVELICVVSAVENTLHNCVNELCIHCGKYHESYLGACDGCPWLEVKEGFRHD